MQGSNLGTRLFTCSYIMNCTKWIFISKTINLTNNIPEKQELHQTQSYWPLSAVKDEKFTSRHNHTAQKFK